MEKSTCSDPECGRRAHARGMCTMHYQRAKCSGALIPFGVYPPDNLTDTPCKVPACTDVARKGRRGMCNKHAERIRLTGTTDDPERPKRNGILPCSVDGCDKVSKAGGRTGRLLCVMHYERFFKYGDPLITGRLSACTICGAPFVKRNRQRCCSVACRKELVAREGYAKKRRALEEQRTVEKFTRAEIFDRDNWVCHLCGGPIDRDAKPRTSRAASLDHVIPLSLGGEHSRANTRAAHHGCNARKGNRTNWLGQVI